MIIENCKNFLKNSALLVKKIVFYDLKLFFYIKKCCSFIFKLYFKVNIRLLHFITENMFGYLVYLFVMVYGTYGGRDTGVYETSHYISLFITMYLLGQAVELYVLCKIPFTRKLLDNLLTKEYILKYLGEHTMSKLFLKMAVPLVGTAAIEVYTAEQSLERNSDAVKKVYTLCHGDDAREWPPKIKKEFTEENKQIRSDSKNGIITHTINSEKTKSVTHTVATTIKDTAKAIFGKDKD